MSETTMPAAEATTAEANEFATYELAFHILPTVAEGEVPTAFTAIKDHITKNGGEIVDEEAPARIDLAYNIEKYLEGKYRKFSSAYFGWVRFTVSGEAIAEITEEVEGDSNTLRHLLIKLSKQEEEHAFRYHEAFADEAQVETIDVAEAIAEAESEQAKAKEAAETAETAEEDKEEADKSDEVEASDTDEEKKA